MSTSTNSSASQKGLAPILIVLILAALVGGYLIYQKQTKLIPQKPKTAEEYCKIVNSVNKEYEKVRSVRDCGKYKVTDVYNCIDCGNGILDKNWKQIDSCGGLGGWSKQCQEKYYTKETCITTSCIK